MNGQIEVMTFGIFDDVVYQISVEKTTKHWAKGVREPLSGFILLLNGRMESDVS